MLVPATKVREVSHMLKAIYAQEMRGHGLHRRGRQDVGIGAVDDQHGHADKRVELVTSQGRAPSGRKASVVWRRISAESPALTAKLAGARPCRCACHIPT